MKVCVIGDSHSAALKLGWQQVAGEFPGLALTFFGAPGKLINDIAVEDGAIVPTSRRTRTFFHRTSGGQTRIAPVYERILLCGMRFSVWPPLVVYDSCRAEGDPPDARRPLSDACYRRAMEDYLADTPCIATAQLARAISDAPMGVVPVPFPSAASDKPVTREHARERGDEAKVARGFEDAAAALGRRIGFRPLFPPPSVLASPLATKPEYAVGSVAMELNPKLHDPEEHLHMNAGYGAEVLRAVLPALLG